MCNACGDHMHEPFVGDDGEHGSAVLMGPDGKIIKVVIPDVDLPQPKHLDRAGWPLPGEFDAELPHGAKVERSYIEGWPDGDSGKDKKTMVALRIPPEVGGLYGRDAEHMVELEPLQDRHITLTYTGKQPPAERQRLHDSVRRWMAEAGWGPLDGQAQGWGTFTQPKEGGNGNVLWMGWDIPGLAEMRHDLKERLLSEGFDVSEDHDFVPHETVGYTKSPIPALPEFPADPVNHTFDGLVVAEGDDWTEYPFHQGQLVYPSGRLAIAAALWAAGDVAHDAEDGVLIAAGKKGAAENLKIYWSVGPGGAKIRWGTKGDWKRCERHLRKYIGPGAKGYCFSGDTEFLTRDGVMTFAEAAGTRQFVLTQASPVGKRSPHAVRRDGYWVEAPIMSFGEQRLLTVTLKRGGVEKVIRATPEHRWFAAPNARNVRRFDVEELTTEELRPGMALTALVAEGVGDMVPSPDGIRAGFVFGDGHRQSIGTTRVDVWGEKQGDVLPFFDGYRQREVKAASGLLGTRVNGLPPHLKNLPTTTDVEYLYGWLAGYIAADGAVTPRGALTLSSKSEEHLRFAKHAADLLGIATSGIGVQMRKGFNGFDTPLYRLTFMGGTIPFGLILRKQHRESVWGEGGPRDKKLRLRWTVESVEDHGDVEEVFCATVPVTHSFVLTDNVWSPNCQNMHKMMTGMYTGDMRHRILHGWGGKPGSYWAKVAAKNALAASGPPDSVPIMDERIAQDDPRVVPVSADSANPLVMLMDRLQAAQKPVSFRIPLLLPEGVESGDGRTFEEGVVEHRDLPIPLLWQPNSMQGHDGAMIVGRIDSLERTENGIGNARGVFDTSPIAQEAVRMIRDGFLRGVSADLDKFEAKILGKGSGVATAGKKKSKDDDVVAPDKMSIKQGRIMAATLVAKPAFEQARIELLEGDMQPELIDGAPAGQGEAIAASLGDGIYRGEMGKALRRDAARFVARLRGEGGDPSVAVFTALVASGGDSEVEIPVTPPAHWFENPGLSKPTHLTITDDGRVFGHIAAWGIDHIGMGFGTRPPKSKSNYSYFRTGLLRTAEGNDIRVGQITLAGGHAALKADARAAVKHYDDTESAFADVVAGEDRHGIWVAGALRPGVTAGQLRAARASSPSGDWRPINGRLELVAVCQVNVPGFPVVEARVASGEVMALVAAGTSVLIADLVAPEAEETELSTKAAEANTDEEEAPPLPPGPDEAEAEETPEDESELSASSEEDAEEEGAPEEAASAPEVAAVSRAVRRRDLLLAQKSAEAAAAAVAAAAVAIQAAAEGAEDVEDAPELAAEEPEAPVEVAASAAVIEDVAQAALLEEQFFAAKAKMLRARVGMPAASVLTASGDDEDSSDAEPTTFDEMVRGLTIREAAALLFAAQVEAEQAEQAEVEAVVAAAERGDALSDGSWWIVDEDDLMAAVEEFGACQGRERRIVKNHIKRRARDMGAPELVPMWWWTERELGLIEGAANHTSTAELSDQTAEVAAPAPKGELAAALPGEAELSKQPVSTERRKEMAAKGTAMPGGKYPIADVEDLKRAIKAYGRAKASERAKVRRHIIKRARALGKADLIPENWQK